MKLRNSIQIALSEIRNEKFLFVLFSLVFTILFSLSVSVMDAAVFLPERVAKTVRENNLDTVEVISNGYPQELENYFLGHNIAIHIKECEFTTALAVKSRYFDGKALFKGYASKKEDDQVISNLSDLTEEEFYHSSMILISDKVAESENLQHGDTVDLVSAKGQNPIQMTVAGIFPADSSLADYYVSGYVHTICQKNGSGGFIIIRFIPENLRDIFSIRTLLDNDRYNYSMVNEMLDTIRVLYITMYFVNLVLIISLSGIIWNFMQIYLDRRLKFYSLYLALGMTHRDILRILFCITQLLTAGVGICSSLVSACVLNWLGSQANRLFCFSKGVFAFPLIPMLADLLLIELCLLAIMLKFRKVLVRKVISDQLRYE